MVILDVSNWLPNQDSLPFLGHQLYDFGVVLAQRVEDPDVLGKMQSGFKNFIESGQVWALGIGFVLGYMFRNFTAY